MLRLNSVVATGMLLLLGACSSLSKEKRTDAQAAASAKTKHNSKSGLEFVYIPSGKFHFGCEPQDPQCDDDEKPGRDESVSGFWLGKTDVTVAAWQKCVAAGACEEIAKDDEQHRCNYKNGRLDHPMNCIDWKQAQAFCAWIDGRLPTEVEWEYAAKGGESRIYPWGDAPLDATRANVCDKQCRSGDASTASWAATELDDGFAATSSVGSFPAGASRLGLLDMVGNVWQWTASSAADASAKVQRGGAWAEKPSAARASSRYSNDPTTRHASIGLRCGL